MLARSPAAHGMEREARNALRQGPPTVYQRDVGQSSFLRFLSCCCGFCRTYRVQSGVTLQ